MMVSILLTIKQLLNVDPDNEEFDIQILTFLNSVFGNLAQLGVGPAEGFVITGNKDSWTDFIADESKLQFIKTYIYAKTRLYFDPPQNASALGNLKELISELEWRILVMFDVTQ